ncbi:WAP four-disulfide core domain protein 1 isoform X2 [Electrophorus electricus]|nr:WAP four-disulfide core domain protein 1 isoform X2 [Electrophorus electricus]
MLMAGARVPGRMVWATLLVCLLLLEETNSGSARRFRRGVPRHKDYEYPNQSQSTQHQKSDRCPPPPQMLPAQACEVPACHSDSKCERHKRCCYNGCTYTCLDSVQPPPVLDWLVPPKPRWLGGNSWLLDGPEEVLQAEACSTTEDGDAPLLCPTGYECHIINPGNPSTGVPNRGQCVKHRRNSGTGRQSITWSNLPLFVNSAISSEQEVTPTMLWGTRTSANG